MPRKKMTPEQRKAWGEKMKLAREAKKRAEVETSPSAPQITPEEPSVAELLKRIQELESRQFFSSSPQATGVQVTPGGVVGTVTKHPLQASNYLDPRSRLFDEPKLRLKGFTRDWWDLDWSVNPINYDTKDGLHISEPRFELKLIRIVEDPETGEPSAKRYVLCRINLFYDEGAAIAIAAEQGHEIPEQLEKAFLDEMLYLRIRDWVLESFYPPKPVPASTKQESVIGNRLVEVFEINSAESATIPFNEIQKKL